MPERRLEAVEGRLVHPACVWGEALHPDENPDCDKHPEKPAVCILYYPTRHACADCVAEFEGTG